MPNGKDADDTLDMVNFVEDTIVSDANAKPGTPLKRNGPERKRIILQREQLGADAPLLNLPQALKFFLRALTERDAVFHSGLNHKFAQNRA